MRVVLLGTWLTLSATPVNPLWYFQLRRLFRRLHVDVVNAHSPVPYLADMAIFAAGPSPDGADLSLGIAGEGHRRHRRRRAALRTNASCSRVIFARATRHVAVSPVASNLRTGRADADPARRRHRRVRPAARTAPATARSCTSAGSRRRRGGRAWTSSSTRSRSVPGRDARVRRGRRPRAGASQSGRAALGVGDRIRWHGAVAAAAASPRCSSTPASSPCRR